MKKISWIVITVLFLCFCGCVSSATTDSSGREYSSLANEHDFDYFFPSHNFSLSFNTLEEAFDFVKTAQIKFTTSSAKAKAAGLGAKLIGPPAPVSVEQPVIMYCMLRAQTNNESIDLSKIEKPLEQAIKEAVSVSLVFLVFCEDRGASVSNFHLKSGYRYSSNSQIKSFTISDNVYSAEYPVGWKAEKAFSYLMKEID